MLPGHARRLLKACRLAVNHHSVHTSQKNSDAQNNNAPGMMASTGRSTFSGMSGDGSSSSSLVSLSCPECAHQFTMNLLPRSSSMSSTGRTTPTTPSPPTVPIVEARYSNDTRNKSNYTESPHSVETDPEFKFYINNVSTEQSTLNDEVDGSLSSGASDSGSQHSEGESAVDLDSIMGHLNEFNRCVLVV